MWAVQRGIVEMGMVFQVGPTLFGIANVCSQAQQCNNFKDPGVQLYGGKLFSEIRDDADDVFNNLPFPKPNHTGFTAVPPPTMAAYNNCYSGCIEGASLIELASGERRRIDELRRGDLVLAPAGISAEVVCLVRTVCPDSHANLVELPGSGLRLTPYHPVFIDGEWRFPADIAQPRVVACGAVFSLELRAAPAFLAAGVPCVTLGHGIEEGAALHSYFGTERVLEDIRKFPGYSGGLVDLQPGCVMRDPTTGLVCGLQA